MQDSVLNEALKRLAAEASTRFTSLVATGDEIPFDVAENNGESSHFYRYVPLTSNYIGSHLDELKSLPGYGPARGAVAGAAVAAPFLEARGLKVPSDPDRRAEEMLEVFITELWQGTTEFSLDLSRVEQSLASLEVATRDIREADVLIAPLTGFEMTPSEVEFLSGARIVQADSVEAPLEATSSEGSDRSAWQPAYLAMAPLGDGADGPRKAINALHDLIRALRLFKEGSVGLGPYAYAPVGEEAWRRIETGSAPSRPGSYFLIESEVSGLDEFIGRLSEDALSAERISFAEQRFQYGCERSRPLDALSDHLLAIRSALGGEGVIDAPLAARAAALITGEAGDGQSRERIEAALDLEQSLINSEDAMTAGNESASYLAAWIEDSARHILREAVLGKYGPSLNVTAEETLITSGLRAGGEGSAVQMGTTAEWDLPGEAEVEPDAEAAEAEIEPDAEDAPAPREAEIHVLRPRGADSFAAPDEAGVDPLFGSVPEFAPEPLPEKFDSMPEIEAALGIETKWVGAEDSTESEDGSTVLLEPVPDPGEITVSAESEIGSSLSEDWLSDARPGGTLEWPALASDRPSGEIQPEDHPQRDSSLFPSPETTEWSVGELEYRRNRPAR